MPDPFDYSEFHKASQFMQDPAGGDRGLGVRFFTDEVEDAAATLAAGRPIFKTAEFCEIRIPGDKSNIRVGRVDKMKPDPRLRFAEAYARFQRGEKVQVAGSLLREWPVMARAEARSYEALGIYTVEQLAAMTDQNCAGIQGAIGMRQKAKDFLALSDKMAPLAQARAENETLRAEMAALREMVEALGGKPVASRPPPPLEVAVPLKADGTPRRKPGPKPKAEPPPADKVN